MASLQQLIDVVSQMQGIERPTVEIIARHLREAGLITTGKRGRAPAQMTTRDATNLLIAAVIAKGPASAVETVQTYRASREERDKGGGKRLILGDYFESLLDEARSDKLMWYAAELAKKVIKKASKDEPPHIVDHLKKRYSALIKAGVRIHFQRPFPAVKIHLIAFPKFVSLPGEMAETLHEIEFLPVDDRFWRFWRGEDEGPDRKEIVLISERTIFAIADTLGVSA